MKCHLQFASIAVTWRIRSTPGLHRLTQGGVLLWRGFWEGGRCTKASKHDRSFPRAPGLCLPRVLRPGELAQPPLSEFLCQRNTLFLWGLAPEASLDFIFPLITYLYPSCFSWAAGRVQLPSRPLPGSVMQLRASLPSSPLYLPPLPSSTPPQFPSDPLQS